MITQLGDRYDPAWNGTPPAMIAGDFRVWQRVKQTILKDAINVYYDVGVGYGQPAPPGTDENMKYMWLVNNQRRIDVLVEYADSWRLIELRENAKEQEVGRLEMYLMLLQKDPPNEKQVTLTLISGVLDKHVRDLAKSKGIEYIVV